MPSFVQMGIIKSSKYQALFASRPKDSKGKGKKKNQKDKFDAPKPKENNQQQEESSGSKKHKNKGNQGKEKVKRSYCGKGFHPKHACMKNKLDEATSLLERNNINISEIFRRKENQDREYQHERGHVLMESTLNSKTLLIYYGASNHMMANKDSFSSLDTTKSIPIHMGDDSTIISKGQGTVNLEHGYFSNVLYVPYLASNLLSFYQMNNTRVPKRVSFSLDDVEITELASEKLLAKGSANHHAKAYEFSHFVEDAIPIALLTHGNEVSRI